MLFFFFFFICLDSCGFSRRIGASVGGLTILGAGVGGRRLEGLREIGNDIVDVLGSDRYPDEVLHCLNQFCAFDDRNLHDIHLGHTAAEFLVVAELLVGGPDSTL